MYISFNAPHDPRQAPQKYLDMYPPDQIKIPQPFLGQVPLQAKRCSARRGPSRDEKLAPHPRTEHAVRVNRAEYYAIITHLDDQIKRILDALEPDRQGRQHDTSSSPPTTV